MKKEPFLQVSKRRNKARWQERLLIRFIALILALLCISIGLAPAFKMKFWNIGAEGQILIGGACSAAAMIYAGDKMPAGLLLIVMFVASALGGMIWGMIPALIALYSGKIRKVPIQSASSIRLQKADGFRNCSGRNMAGM